VTQPLVGDLRLPTVADLLIEDAELVADTVTDRRTFQRRQRIEITGGESPQATVTQSGSSSQDKIVSRSWPSSATAARASCSSPRLTRLLPRCGPIRNSPIDNRRFSDSNRNRSGWYSSSVLHAVAHRKRESTVIVVRARDRRQATDGIAQVIGHSLFKGNSRHGGAHSGIRQWRFGSGRAPAHELRWVLLVIVTLLLARGEQVGQA